eukprot:7167904-Prymnesium_polylepis.1
MSYGTKSRRRRRVTGRARGGRGRIVLYFTRRTTTRDGSTGDAAVAGPADEPDGRAKTYRASHRTEHLLGV